jgi:hypothetical protein
MIALSDRQLQVVMTAAEPLPPESARCRSRALRRTNSASVPNFRLAEIGGRAAKPARIPSSRLQSDARLVQQKERIIP